MSRIRYLVAGALFAAALRWAWLAWRSPAAPRSWSSRAPMAHRDPETGLQLRTRLTPAELAAAREAERTAVLVG